MGPEVSRYVTLALLIAACASTGTREGAPGEETKQVPASPRILQPDHAPTPFTAEQIRAGCPDGRTSTYLIEADLSPSMRQTLRFQKGDAEGAELEITRATADGKPVGEPAVGRSTWKTFQSHASFPREAVTIGSERITTPAGTFDCMVYTVTAEKDGKQLVRRMHFAKNLPGPPVKLTQHVDGKLVMTMTLVEQAP